MTGLRPDTTRVWDLVTRFRHTTPNAVTIPQHFKNHGYHTVSYGKVFHNPWPDNQSWDEPHQWPQDATLWSPAAKRRHAEYKQQMQADGRTPQQIQRMRPQATERVDVPDDLHIDGAIARQASVALERLAKQDKPFFLAAGFIRPHLPFVVPRKYWDMYDAKKLKLADNPFLPKHSPAFAMNTMYELRDYFDFDGTPDPRQEALSEQQQRTLKHGYYAAVTFIDTLVGQLLDDLDRLGIADNTIVVLWGDHGWKLGEHNSWCKQTNYEIDARVPLIVRAPGMKASGQHSSALVELVDVYPTLCELAGLPILKELEGRSFSLLLENAQTPWKRAAFSQFKRQKGKTPVMGYSMRTDRYRYVEWQNRRTGDVLEVELYDHKLDPAENENIAKSPDQEQRLSDLSRRMWTLLPEPPQFVEPQRKRPRVFFHNQTQTALKLFWVPEDGQERLQGTIKPGTRMPQNTTVGHQFRVRGPDGFSKMFTVEKANQTFNIKAQPVAPPTDRSEKISRPNIVFFMADDWSWPHASILGAPVVKTPNFDRLASEGVLFSNAFVSTPSCTPSRLSILTGQHHWRLREGDSLGGSLREEYPVYTELLKKVGYLIGRYGKGVWPSKHTFRQRDSFGEKFVSFDAFLAQRLPGQPFCFWYGGQDPHRPYELNVGVSSGMKLSEISVPACLPDSKVVRSDVADYLWEVQRFDREVGEVVAKLEAIGALDNTIIVVSGDNGMPFPRCKATLYDLGTRVPLCVRWGDKIESERTIDDFVSLCDLAPTFLQAAGEDPPAQMTGRSLLPILRSTESGQLDPERSFVLTGVEQHVYSYPKRAIRTKEYLFIRNFQPESWPTGETKNRNAKFDFQETPWPTIPGAFSYAIDPSPTKQFLRLRRDQPAVKKYASKIFTKPPREELYDLRKDPDQLNNVVSHIQYAQDADRLRKKLQQELAHSQDPRVVGSIKTRVHEKTD